MVCLVVAVVLVVTGAWFLVASVVGQGGPAARAVGGLRRRWRVLGGGPLAGGRAFSCWRVFQVCRMRWLRAISSVVANSISGARPMSRHQPRLMSLVAGSLVVAKPRSAPVRRA